MKFKITAPIIEPTEGSPHTALQLSHHQTSYVSSFLSPWLLAVSTPFYWISARQFSSFQAHFSY
ncbi:hypothetical protein AB4259_02220 [Vibrio amylolyticus]|uniref:hypothetical protein n=1 Tax=Vibrio amylolyticus TaxID=2847292 RepID=UPI0035521155